MREHLTVRLLHDTQAQISPLPENRDNRKPVAIAGELTL
jgi:hypothetical protein